MEKNGNYNFQKLDERVKRGLDESDLERIYYELANIKGATLVSGVGGSSVVSEMASKVLTQKNHIITRNTEPRDFNYMSLEPFKNVLACSYSGNNFGVEVAFLNELKHYLLMSKENPKQGIHNITYHLEDKEKSFISLAATLLPCSILLSYFLDGNKDRVIELLEKEDFEFDGCEEVFEIFSGYETSVAAKYLESTLIEAGLGIPIIHDKYSYCHGRSTTCLHHNSTVIYFNGGTELDKLLLKELPKYYKRIIPIDISKGLEGDFQALVRAMYLTKNLADSKKMDISGVDYNPIVKQLYKYNGEM